MPEEKRKVGRPTKLNDKVLDDIISILRLGLSERTAQEFVGVDHSTFERWKVRDDNFATTIKKAQAEARVKMTTKLVRQIEDNNTTSLIFWLKTRAKSEFTERTEYDIGTPQPIKVFNRCSNDGKQHK
jgi:transposase